jgi:thiol-disulfide isomerase/thioredoxin
MRHAFATCLFACLFIVGGPVSCERATDDSAPSAAPSSPSTHPTSSPAADLELKDATGATHQPLEVKDAAGAVLIFIATDCPISNSYAPEINRICTEYGGEGPGRFRFYLVYADPDLTPAAAGKHAHDFGYTCPTLLDTQHRLVERLRARVTPEAVVIGPDGAVRYNGRIDDKWAAYGKARPEPTTRELRAALDAIRAGRPVATPETEAIGCPIEPR